MTSEPRLQNPLCNALNEAITALASAGADGFDAGLTEALRRSAELEKLAFAAVLGGSIREGSCGWCKAELAPGWCDELHGVLFDEAGDAIRDNREVVLAERGEMGGELCRSAELLGVESMLVIRMGDGGDAGAALVLGAPDERHWPTETRALFAMLGAVVTGLAQREREDAARMAVDAELHQTRNLGAIGKLSGSIAHDINDMLVPIIGHTEAIVASGGPAASDPGLAAILRSAQGAADLTKQLLAFSQKQTLVKKPTDLSASIRSLLPALERMLGDGVELSHRAPESPWPVQVDRGQFEQVVMNLCSNARDAMDGDGPIEITVENVNLGKGGNYLSGDHIRLGVRDRGCGIAGENFDQIFEPFHTTKGRGGAGLGLPVAQGIVEQHGGWIEVESVIGKGSVFAVLLPAERDAAVPDSGRTRVSGTTPDGATVLLVDDEPRVLSFVKQMLQAKGYMVTTAGSRGEAFTKLNAIGAKFDLVFTDAMLPDGTGMEVILRARAITPGVRALLSSGYSDDRSLLARAEAEEVDFLSKPYSLEELTEAVESALCAPLVS